MNWFECTDCGMVFSEEEWTQIVDEEVNYTYAPCPYCGGEHIEDVNECIICEDNGVKRHRTTLNGKSVLTCADVCECCLKEYAKKRMVFEREYLSHIDYAPALDQAASELDCAYAEMKGWI